MSADRLQRDGRFDHTIVTVTNHRLWPLPNRPWLMTQSWHDLLFIHWPIAANELRPLVPDAFEIDRFDGQAWLAVVPFRMTNVAPRFVPAIPGISAFPELNVRTYVRVGDRAGVYFFSLDAGSSVAVQVARALLNLPYYTASMSVQRHGSTIDYRCERDSSIEFRATYEPYGETCVAAPGSLEYFLTERYCFYHASRRGRPYRLEVHHPPWPLQRARLQLHRNTMTVAHRLTLPDTEPLVHFAKRQDVVVWGPSRLED